MCRRAAGVPAQQRRGVGAARALPPGPHGAAAARARGPPRARRAALALHAPLRQLPVLHQRHTIAGTRPEKAC